jgi:type VI protein secretion system component Hcp
MRNSLALLIGSALAIDAAFWFVSAADAAKKTSGKPSISEISVTKPSDKASPTIMRRPTTPGRSKYQNIQLKRGY